MILLYGLALYLAIGLATALAFVSFGVTRVAHASVTAGGRVLILPGAIMLWPFVLSRWLKARRLP